MGGGYPLPNHLIWLDNLKELFYDRNPGDARVKVGSDRQAASRPTRRMSCRRDRLYNNMEFARGDPPNLALLYGNSLRQSSSGAILRFVSCQNRVPKRGGGEVGTGPEPVPRQLICFGRRI